MIDTNPRRDKTLAEELRTEARRLKNLGFQLAEQVRYNERTAGERVNGRLKDEFWNTHRDRLVGGLDGHRGWRRNCEPKLDDLPTACE